MQMKCIPKDNKKKGGGELKLLLSRIELCNCYHLNENGEIKFTYLPTTIEKRISVHAMLRLFQTKFLSFGVPVRRGL